VIFVSSLCRWGWSVQVPYRDPGMDYHRYVDINQRLYYDRVLLCGQFIDDRVSNQLMSTLWYLHQQDKNKPIYM
jgi:ATP-dependent protease ClpP protease subunit